jgi:hypothetical protein
MKVRSLLIGIAALTQTVAGAAAQNAYIASPPVYGPTNEEIGAPAYPVSGRWTFQDAGGQGPAPRCGGRVMAFRGAQRFDTGGGISQFRNVGIIQESPTRYLVVDEFFNVMIRGRVGFVLSIRDHDHIEIQLEGNTFRLRRCA